MLHGEQEEGGGREEEGRGRRREEGGGGRKGGDTYIDVIFCNFGTKTYFFSLHLRHFLLLLLLILVFTKAVHLDKSMMAWDVMVAMMTVTVLLIVGYY